MQDRLLLFFIEYNTKMTFFLVIAILSGLCYTLLQEEVGQMAILKKVWMLFFKRDIFAFFLLGLSCGIPLNLIGNTLAVRATQSGLDLKTIGLFALVMTPIR